MTAKTPRKVHLRLRFQNPGKPRTAGLCGRAVGACDCGPLSCFLFCPRKSREKCRKRSHTNVSSTLSTRSSTPPAQTPQRSFRGAATGTHLPSPTGSHTAAHTAKHGAFRMGALLLPSERSTRFGNPAWPGFKTANLPLLGLGRRRS